MPMYILIEYSESYSDTSRSWWQFKRDEVLANNANLSIDNSQSFRYKAALLGKTWMLIMEIALWKVQNSCSIKVFEQIL